MPEEQEAVTALTTPPSEIDPDLMKQYVFPGTTWADKTPLDYEENDEGFRKGVSVKPTGIIKHNLLSGTNDCVLPPLAVWDRGRWLQDLSEDGQETLKEYLLDPNKEAYCTWVVTGEYTPGNYIARIYVIPRILANQPIPDHPLTWSAYHKNGKATTAYGKPVQARTWQGGTGYGVGAGSRTTAPATTAPAKPPTTESKMPAKVRMRCGGCGHWWKMDDLKAHLEYCCPGVNGDDSDWAFQCECCDTLDEVQECKPGFPRPKKEPKPEVAKEPEATAEPAALAEATQDA